MKRGLVGFLLAFALTFLLAPGVSSAEEALGGREYDVWVRGRRVTDSNRNDVLGGGNVVYTPASGGNSAKLTFTGEERINAYKIDGMYYGILAREDLEIVINGSLSILCNEEEGYDANHYGICAANADLKLSGGGSGSLFIAMGKANGHSAAGILCNDLSTEGSFVFDISEHRPAESPYGISAMGNVTLGNRDVTIGMPQNEGEVKSIAISADGEVSIPNEGTYRLTADRAVSAESLSVSQYLYINAEDRNGNSVDYVPENLSTYSSLLITKPGYFDVTVWGIRISQMNQRDVLGDGGSVSFEPGEGEDHLYLRNANIHGGGDRMNAAIVSRRPLVLHLEGQNIISMGMSDMDTYGIYVGDGSNTERIDITGEGSLEIYLDTSSGNVGAGIRGKIIAIDGPDVTVNVRTNTKLNAALWADSTISVKKSDFYASGGPATAVDGAKSYGVMVGKEIWIPDGTFTIRGETKAISGGLNPGQKMSVRAGTDVSGSTLTAYEEGQLDSYRYITGVYVPEGIGSLGIDPTSLSARRGYDYHFGVSFSGTAAGKEVAWEVIGADPETTIDGGTLEISPVESHNEFIVRVYQVADPKIKAEAAVTIASGGLQMVDGELHFFIGNMPARNRWIDVENYRFYFGNDGIAYRGIHQIGDSIYCFNEKTRDQEYSLWKSSGDKTYYFDIYGTASRGLKEIGDQWYYFEPKTAVQFKNGWKSVDTMMYYFNKFGPAYKGFRKIGNQYYYFDPESAYQLYNCWKTVGGKTYYFNSYGPAYKGLREIKGVLYFFDPREAYQYKDRWATAGGKTYYLNKYGVALKGPRKIKGVTYFFDPRQAYQYKDRWATAGGKTYYLNRYGVAVKGLVKIGKFYYGFSPDGVQYKDGWYRIGDKEYFFNKYGVMKASR